MLGAPPGTVASWLTRTKARLRRELQAMEEHAMSGHDDPRLRAAA